MKISMNTVVRVKLTKYGYKVLREYYTRIRAAYADPMLDDSGYTTFQLWELMGIFGDVMYLGNTDVPFNNNEIIVEPPKECVCTKAKLKKPKKTFPSWCVNQTETDIRRLLSEQLGVKPEIIGRETHVRDDLGADSLDIVEVVMVLEQHFKIDVPDEVYEKINWRVCDIIEMVNKVKGVHI